MPASVNYQPSSSADMIRRQDEPKALRYLITQRRLYRRAKRWLGIRWFGMLVIGLAAPLISVIHPDLATAVGAVAGVWIFLGRTAVQFFQSKTTSAAASTQERFDLHVYGMPASVRRSALPSLEGMAEIAGSDDELLQVAERERLLQWYPLKDTDAGDVSVAICQRANAAYSDQLLQTTARIWAGVTAVWAVGLVIASVAFDLTLPQFLVGVFLPVLPAFLDVGDYVHGIQKSARLRRDLVVTIEARLGQAARPLDSGQLLVWQAELYDLRRTTPQVPDFVYGLRRRVNERAMHSAADQLRGDNDGGA